MKGFRRSLRNVLRVFGGEWSEVDENFRLVQGYTASDR
jgi:hypothetical protein